MKSNGFNLRLHLPSFMLKSRLVAKEIGKKSDVDVAAAQTMLKNVYGVLKKYRKKYGKITLVDIQSHDGDVIKIVF